jgi:DNA polymerase (family 10)
MENQRLAEIFNKIADALEFKGENKFKIIAYRKAAQVLSNLTSDIYDYYKENKLEDIPGIGEGIAKKIKEYFEKGKVSKLEEVTKDIPDGILDLLNIPSLGPKTLYLAYKELGVKNLEDLERVINDGSLAKLPQMGEKKVENIKNGIELFKKAQERMPLGKAYLIVNEIINELKDMKEVKLIEPAGSFRRMKETVGDIDILVMSEEPEKVMERFVNLKIVERVLAKGDTKSSIITNQKIQVDLRVIKKESWGAALQYFTGSKAHNIKLRGIAKNLGYKINEYGIFKDDKYICGSDEKEVYEKLGLQYIPPELREDLGEIELALKNNLPEIVDYANFPGDLHIHSNYSDGSNSIEEIVKEAIKYNYRFVAIADHSQSAKYAGGLSIDELIKRNKEIDEIQKKYPNIKILKAMEVDILGDGSLDYPDEILKQLDIVIAAIHTGLKKEPEKRILKAMENPYVKIIAHPTGRLISSRESYSIDLEKIFKKAAERNIALEINSYYDRLDLNDYNCRKAREYNVKMAIGTDSHNVESMWQIKLGIGVARRAWLSKKDIYNFQIL